MEISPYLSVGLLKLNMNKKDVQKAINEEPITFVKGEEPAEHYVKSGILVYYNEDGETSNAYEFLQNAHPTLNGINFLNMNYKTAKKVLENLDNNLFEDEDTIISFKYGLSLYIPNNKVESLLVFEEGYYNEYFNLIAELNSDE